MKEYLSLLGFTLFLNGLFIRETNAFIAPKAFSTKQPIRHQIHVVTQLHQSTSTNSDVGQSSTIEPGSSNVETTTQMRPLGSQELLMLPRQYGPHLDKNKDPFPQMSHVSAVTLSATPSLETLSQAIDEAMTAHPLLRCYVEGDGEPGKRIDAFQMVREGNPSPETFVCPKMEESNLSSENVLIVIDVEGSGSSDDVALLSASWNNKFETNLDSGADWCDVQSGPLWKVELHRLTNGGKDAPCALVFTFNHAISDQSSVNMLMDHIISNMASIESSGKVKNPALKQKIPISMEDSVLGMKKSWSDVQTTDMSLKTASYVAGKAAEGLSSPVILPDDPVLAESNQSEGNALLGALTIISGNAAGGENNEERKSTVQFRTVPENTVNALLKKCRNKGVTMSNVLSAAIALTSSDFIDGGQSTTSGKRRNYKVLQSLDMRRFGANVDSCDTVSCMAGSHDLMLGPIPDNSGRRIRDDTENVDLEKEFWSIAKKSKAQTREFIESGGPEEATRVFDFAMSISDMNNLVYLSSQSKDTLGRAYSAGIVNAGVFEKQKSVQRSNDADRANLQTKHGRFEIQEVHYATSHARSGCLYQASCLTINNELMCTFHPASPIVTKEKNNDFADSFVQLLEIVSGVGEVTEEEKSEEEFSLLKNLPMLAAVGYGLFGIVSHANAWTYFFSSVEEMKNNVPNPEDFWAALNFWIFFAVGHPILQPILWISDVLHGTPGPVIGDLVPALFLGGNLAFIALLSISKEFKNAVNVFALSAFLTYVGAGLDGKAGLGDYNLGLDDNYRGSIVKGCPSYDEVRQSSMDNFDINRYEGLWYEIKFHDWTQFKEVYDTTLDIKVRKKEWQVWYIICFSIHV